MTAATEEMVDAALAMWFEVHKDPAMCRIDMKATIEAALAVAPPSIPLALLGDSHRMALAYPTLSAGEPESSSKYGWGTYDSQTDSHQNAAAPPVMTQQQIPREGHGWPPKA